MPCLSFPRGLLSPSAVRSARCKIQCEQREQRVECGKREDPGGSPSFL